MLPQGKRTVEVARSNGHSRHSRRRSSVPGANADVCPRCLNDYGRYEKRASHCIAIRSYFDERKLRQHTAPCSRNTAS